MKPLIIGEAPSKRGDASTPCAGRIGVVLADLCGLTYEGYLERFDRVNLLDKYPGAEGKGSRFEAIEANQRAHELDKAGLFKNRHVVILGRRASRAFALERLPWFQWTSDGITWYAVIPHPSGINTWYNDTGNIEKAAAFMRSVAR